MSLERLPAPEPDGRQVRLTVDLPIDFALNQPLSPFALAALEPLDRDSPTYALEVVSVIESIPRIAPSRSFRAGLQGPR